VTNDDNAPATKGDLNQLRGEMKAEMEMLRNQLNEDFVNAMKASNEQLVHDFAGIFNDRTQQHTDKLEDHNVRIRRVESHLGWQHAT